MPATDKRLLKVFLCHASQDKPSVRELAQRLFVEGWIDPWLDEKKLLPGQDWRLKIEEAVETSDIVIICLSSNSVSKEGFIQKELRYAREIALEKLEESIFLIPLRIDECDVPRGLRFYQWADYFGEKKEETFSALLESLKLRYEQKLRAEEEERIRWKKERLEREAAEKIAREKVEREFSEMVAREQAEREIAERVAREKAKRESVETAAREKAKRELAEKIRREKAERQVDRRDAIKKLLPLMPFLRIIGIFGIIIVLFWAGSRVIPQFIVLIPTPQVTTTSTQAPVAKATYTNSPMSPTKTLKPISTPTKTRTPAPTAIPTEITDAKGVKMVFVQASEFTMGSEAKSNEKPIQNINLDSFYIDKYEVSNDFYRLCVNADVCEAPNIVPGYNNLPGYSISIPDNYYSDKRWGDYPVIFINWVMANTYCEWRDARLPTEAEWEKASRGLNGNTYPWGNTTPPHSDASGNYGDCVYANFYCSRGHSFPLPITDFETGKSIYGAYNMSGNVWEWVSSVYMPYPYNANDGREFSKASSTSYRVLRGGSYGSNFDMIRSSYRFWASPYAANGDFGFRCSVDVNP